MLRVSLLLFFNKHRGHLSPEEQKDVENFVKNDNFHGILRTQITMGPIPKRIKMEETAEQRAPHEYNMLYGFLASVRNP